MTLGAIIPISEEDRPVVIRYDVPLEKVLNLTFKLSLSTACLNSFLVHHARLHGAGIG